MKVVLLFVAALVAVAHARLSLRQGVLPPHRGAVASQFRSDDDSSASDSSEWSPTTTEMPCKKICPLVYNPICVRDSDRVKHLFANRCMLRKCECETGFEYEEVDLKDCEGMASGCPRPSTPYRRPQPHERSQGADSSASDWSE